MSDRKKHLDSQPGDIPGRGWINKCMANSILETFDIKEISPMTFASSIKNDANNIVSSLGVVNAGLLIGALKEAVREAE